MVSLLFSIHYIAIGSQIIIDKYLDDISALTGEDCSGNSTLQVLRLPHYYFIK